MIFGEFLVTTVLQRNEGWKARKGVPEGLKSLRENPRFCHTGNKCSVPHLPRFPVEACGVDTRGPL